MVYSVSITSQGQISIPTQIRRQLGITKQSRANVSVEGKTIVIEPVKDLLELAGSLKPSVKVNATPAQMRKAFEQYLADEGMGKNVK